jgi:hypothetical protein
MRLEFQHYKTKYIVEKENEDVHTEDIVDLVFNLLVQAGYSPTGLAEDFIQKGSEFIKELKQQ